MSETNPVTMVTFLLYVAGTFILAAISHRFLRQKAFLGEYYLGNRGLRSWALAFTFAATATSGGTFIGFPALIYTYGWVLALWISSYMIYPLCAMGVLGKRLNQVARISGAITIPDIFRDRFESPALGLFTTLTILLLTACNLVAQFKAGGIILEETLNLPEEWGYTAGLVIFACVVVAYTAYGGFRAVVWTDVMQGVVMGLGILVLTPIIIWQVGGLSGLLVRLQDRPPQLVTALPGAHNDLAFLLMDEAGLDGVEYRVLEGPGQLQARIEESSLGSLLVFLLPRDSAGNVSVTASEVKALAEDEPWIGGLVRVEFAFENDGSSRLGAMPGQIFIRSEEYLFGPGRRSDGQPFHPLGLALSYFVMWAITAMGQPGMMVRLMAFKDSATLRRAIFIVTVYFALIYLPLVLIFTSAPLLLPYLSPESADEATVLLSTRVVGSLGPGFAILAALFVAAPFAAVMSTVDSFLLIISSAIVRDLYQRTFSPSVAEKTVRRMSYVVTALVGVMVTVLATRRIDFLQYIVIFTSSAFACAFLPSIFLAIYWKGMTRQGALWSSVGGLVVVLALFSPSLVGGSQLEVLGLHPVVWGLAAAGLFGVVASRLTGPPPGHLVERYFTVRDSTPEARSPLP